VRGRSRDRGRNRGDLVLMGRRVPARRLERSYSWDTTSEKRRGQKGGGGGDFIFFQARGGVLRKSRKEQQATPCGGASVVERSQAAYSRSKLGKVKTRIMAVANHRA